MSKHTPGPWTVEHDGPSLPIIMGRASHGFIAFIKDANSGPEEIEANARLIAAAPELLQACQVVRHALISYKHGNASPDLATEAVEFLEAVIAKV